MSCACMMTRISSRICCPALPPRPMVASVQRIHMRQRRCAFHNSAILDVIWFVVPASILGCVHVFRSHVSNRWKENRCQTKIQLQNPSLLALMSSSSGTSKRGIDGMRLHTASRLSTCMRVFQDRIFRMAMPSLSFSHESTKSKQFSYRRFKDICSHVTSCSTILSATWAHSPFHRPMDEKRALALPPLLGLNHSLPVSSFITKLIPAIAGSMTGSEPLSLFFVVAVIAMSRPWTWPPMSCNWTWHAFASTAWTPAGHSTPFCSRGGFQSPERDPWRAPKCSVHFPKRGCNHALSSTFNFAPSE
mmetsp:Transcript_79794/g.243983  ORF Transcript_79794/g.243983 Transcript_79794/m.243983 type:complete len:304 (-) Transcript_79794:1453-2364(-)